MGTVKERKLRAENLSLWFKWQFEKQKRLELENKFEQMKFNDIWDQIARIPEHHTVIGE